MLRQRGPLFQSSQAQRVIKYASARDQIANEQLIEGDPARLARFSKKRDF